MTPRASRGVQDERGEQLKTMTNLSALMAGFAMASFLQFGFEDKTVSVGVLVGFGLTTSVVVRILLKILY